MTGSGFDVVVTCLPLGKVVPAHPASSPRSELSSFGPQSSWLGPSNQLKVAQNFLELLESFCRESILRSLKVLQSTPDQGNIFHAIESYVLNQYTIILRYILFASGDVTCYKTRWFRGRPTSSKSSAAADSDTWRLPGQAATAPGRRIAGGLLWLCDTLRFLSLADRFQIQNWMILTDSYW